MRIGTLNILNAMIAVALGSLSLGASAAPDVAFVAAALRNQEAACGPSLQVQYSVDNLVPTSLVHRRVEDRYVRTPDVLFKEERKGSALLDSFTVEVSTRYRHDRASGQCVALVTRTSSGRMVAVKTTNVPAPGMICIDLLPDPVLYPLDIGCLCDAVRQGVIAESQEEIEGHACWRIDVPERQVGTQTSRRWSMWVDPDIGFCPRRVKVYQTQEGNSRVFTTDFREYKSIADQVYFPMRISVQYDESEGGMLCVVEEAVCGKEVSPEEIAVDIPSGTEVRVLDQQLEYTEP